MNENYNEWPFELSIEEELISKISLGDIDALHKLYELTSNGIYAFVLSILKNPDEAEDVLQDVFLTIYNKAKTYKSMSKPLAWIYTIAKNCCFMKMRKTKKIVKIPVEDIKDDEFFSKVENVEGLENMEEIVENADVQMIARGDMATETDFTEPPVAQKKFINLSNKANKPAITATHMLESMTFNP